MFRKTLHGRRQRRAALLGMIALCAAGTEVHASVGCDAVNSGVFNGTAVGIGPNVNQAGFAAGDRLDITITTSAVGFIHHYQLSAAGFGTIEHTDFGPNVTVSRSYTLTAAQLSLTLERWDMTTAATCTPAFTPSTNTDSAKARAVQIAGSKQVGQASGQAISSSASNATHDLLKSSPDQSSNIGPANLGGPLPSPNGLGMGLRREPPAVGPVFAPQSLSPWKVWGDVRGTGIDDSDRGVAIDSTQVNVTAGIGRRLGRNHAAGLLVGYEDFNYRFAGVGSLKGEGVTVGAYGGMRLMPRLILDAMVAYTRLDYEIAAGTATGGFDAGRWLGAIGLTGNLIAAHGIVLEPSARLYVLRESQDGWTDASAHSRRDETLPRAASASARRRRAACRCPSAH